jgi:transposase InsO family protein
VPRVPDDHDLALAAFRHHLIAEALEADGAALVTILKAQAGQPRTDPSGRARAVSVRTLARWLAAYRRGGLLALCPTRRQDHGALRAIPPEVFARAQALRREKPSRPTKTIIDILVRAKTATPGAIARSTLDRHLAARGLSRSALRSLGQKTFRRIATTAPFELIVADFHHGPYVRTADGALRRALLGAHIDHFSRYIPEGRYFLHEDYAALRFGFRRLVSGFGLPQTYYVDNGPSFQATRFHAACDGLGIRLVHSAPYQSECRGVIERANRTLKEQFETEVRGREEPLTLDELNAYFEAWLAERYHHDVHSETGESPRDRFRRTAVLRAAPDLAQVDELLRLRERRRVHKKWSTVEVLATRYVVDPALRGRKVEVLYDPFTPESVLIVFDGRVVQRAVPQQPGAVPPQTTPPAPQGPATDYLALLRADYERRSQRELAALRLRTTPAVAELPLADLVTRLASCRGTALTPTEHALAAACWRKLRPIDPDAARTALSAAHRHLGTAVHLGLYLDALTTHLVRQRTQEGGTKP